VACHAGNLGKLVGEPAVNAPTIELVILKTKRHVIHHPGAEGVIPIHPQYRRAFEGGTAIADHFRETRKRSSRQVFVIKHFRDVILGSKVLFNFLGNVVGICT